MSVSVVVDEALLEPKRLVSAERAEEPWLDFVNGDMVVAIRVEQALARDEHGAFPVDLDASSLEDVRTDELPDSRDVGDALRHLSIVGEYELAAQPLKLHAESRYRQYR